MKIALIDDDFAVLNSLKQLLGGAGFDVCPFQSAEAFMSAADELDVACVVSDVRLPSMTGMELHHEISRRFPGLPVILITGHGDIEMAVAAVKRGAVDFIEKPFSEEIGLWRAFGKRSTLERVRRSMLICVPNSWDVSPSFPRDKSR